MLSRKAKVEKKLFQYGVTNFKITYLPYLNFSENDFQTTYEAGCRIIILWAVTNIAHNPSEAGEIAEWLMDTSLWKKVSEREKKLFSGVPDQQMLIAASWRIEALTVLCWATNLMEELPDLNQQVSEEVWDEVLSALPIFQNPGDFLKTLTYRNKEEIFIENIVNENITAYLRDKYLAGEKNDLPIDGGVAHERHHALNWLRCFSGISDWDETDTST